MLAGGEVGAVLLDPAREDGRCSCRTPGGRAPPASSVPRSTRCPSPQWGGEGGHILHLAVLREEGGGQEGEGPCKDEGGQRARATGRARVSGRVRDVGVACVAGLVIIRSASCQDVSAWSVIHQRVISVSSSFRHSSHVLPQLPDLLLLAQHDHVVTGFEAGVRGRVEDHVIVGPAVFTGGEHDQPGVGGGCAPRRGSPTTIEPLPTVAWSMCRERWLPGAVTSRNDATEGRTSTDATHQHRRHPDRAAYRLHWG